MPVTNWEASWSSSLSLIRCCAPWALDAGHAGVSPSALPYSSDILEAWNHQQDVQGNVCPSHKHIRTSKGAGCSILSPCKLAAAPSMDIPVTKRLRKGLRVNPRGRKGLQPPAGLHRAPQPSLRCGVPPGAPLLSPPSAGLHSILPTAKC